MASEVAVVTYTNWIHFDEEGNQIFLRPEETAALNEAMEKMAVLAAKSR